MNKIDRFATSNISVSNRIKFGLIASTDITDIRVDEEQATILPLDFYVSSSSPEKNIKLWYAISDHFGQYSKLEFINTQGEIMVEQTEASLISDNGDYFFNGNGGDIFVYTELQSSIIIEDLMRRIADWETRGND